MKLLSNEFLEKYKDIPDDMSNNSVFVFYRTYSRWIKELNRRETYKEMVKRSVEYNVNLGFMKMMSNGYDMSDKQLNSIKVEAETLFDNIYNMRQFLSGRTHWIGGTNASEMFPLANFNCSFTEVKKWDDIIEAFYLLLVGAGVGFRCTKEDAKGLSPIRRDYELIHSEFKPLPKNERIEATSFNIMGNGYAKIYVGDSKDGWVTALKGFLNFVTLKEFEDIKHIKISYNSIRPRGERLKNFGGRASGHEPLKEMFEKIDMVFRNQIDETLAPMEKVDGEERYYVRPVHVLDIANLLGSNVVVGGVRRTAEIFLADPDDEEVLNAKKEYWNNPNLTHRAMSNNSMVFEEQPTRERLRGILLRIKENGEPGFFNMGSAKKRRPNAVGVNPCGEILLDSKGVCNLTTINVFAFVKEKDGVMILDYQGLMQAQALSVRAGHRMTLLDLELAEWDKVHKRDRLIGCSLTGWRDAMDALDYTPEQEEYLLHLLKNVATQQSVEYASTLRIPMPLLSTTVKPEGTLSQVANGVSSGLHASFAPHYIRRIRVSSHDPLAQVAKELGWTINPEVGTKGETYEEKMENAMTYVIDFYKKSTAKKTAYEQTVDEQFENYLRFQENYTEHNSSVTIYVKEHEWERLEELIIEHWDSFVGMSFLPNDNSVYELAPYEVITEEEYERLSSGMKPFDFNLISKYEYEETERDVVNIQSCDAGVCPI